MEYEQFRIEELRDLCRTRGLSTSYRVKRDLIIRLEGADDDVFEHTGGNEDNPNSDSSNESYINVEDNARNSNSDINGENNGSNDENRRNSDERDNSKESSSEKGDEDISDTMSTISFKDVEDAQPKFSGLPHEKLTKWEKEYELTSSTCKWNEVQKYLYARKLMKKEAQKHMEDNDRLSNYHELMAHMKKEYKDEQSIWEIHDFLTQRTVVQI